MPVLRPAIFASAFSDQAPFRECSVSLENQSYIVKGHEDVKCNVSILPSLKGIGL